MLFIFNAVILSSTLNAHAQDCTPLMWRSAKTLSQGGVLIWDSLFYANLVEKYDWDKKDWIRLAGDNSKFSSVTMLGYGITDNLEFLAHIPVFSWTSTKSGDTNTETGIGDMSVQTRYFLNRGSKKWPLVNVSAFARFPTGDDETSPALGDGTTDFAVGTTVQTQKIGNFYGILKLGYVFNGETDNDIDLGDEFMYCLKANYQLTKDLKLSCNLRGTIAAKQEDADGNKIDDTQKKRLYVCPMVIWSPVKGLKIKPKLKIPLKSESEGGKLFDVQYVLECWYVF